MRKTAVYRDDLFLEHTFSEGSVCIAAENYGGDGVFEYHIDNLTIGCIGQINVQKGHEIVIFSYKKPGFFQGIGNIDVKRELGGDLFVQQFCQRPVVFNQENSFHFL